MQWSVTDHLTAGIAAEQTCPASNLTMDIIKIARKLEPLMPKEVQHWLKVLDIADPALRSLAEQQIMMTARRVLGDFPTSLPRGRSRGRGRMSRRFARL